MKIDLASALSESGERLQVHKYSNEFSLQTKVTRFLWELVWLALFRPSPRWCLNRWRASLLRMFGAKVGSNCRIDPSCQIWAPWNLILSDYVSLGKDVDCYSMGPIKLGTKVSISQRTFLCTGSHEIESLERKLIIEPIVVKDFAWVASECMIMPGVTIGEGAVIGARSLVTKDMPGWSVCIGHPCRVIKNRSRLTPGQAVEQPE